MIPPNLTRDPIDPAVAAILCVLIIWLVLGVGPYLASALFSFGEEDPDE